MIIQLTLSELRHLLLCKPPPCPQALLFWHSWCRAFFFLLSIHTTYISNLLLFSKTHTESVTTLCFSNHPDAGQTVAFPSIHNLKRSRYSMRSRPNNSSDWLDLRPTDRVEFPAQYFLRISNIFRHNNWSGRYKKGDIIKAC